MSESREMKRKVRTGKDEVRGWNEVRKEKSERARQSVRE